MFANPIRSSRSRRGAEAVEFALVMPVLVAMVFGSLDYGLYFFERLQVTRALQDAVRAGAMVRPSDAEIEAKSGCDQCVAVATAQANARLDALGADADPSTVAPVLHEIEDVCVLDLTTVLTYTPVIGLISMPETYEVHVRLNAQGAKGC